MRHSARDSRGWIVGLLILGAVVTWFVSHPMGKDAVGVVPDDTATVVPTPQSPTDAPTVAAAPAVIAKGIVTCVEQFLDITAREKQQRSCVSRTQVVQNGNVRSYRVEAQGGPMGALRVDAVGERILHAELTMSSGEPFACGAGHCAGISMAPYDSQGARAILLDKARLTRETGRSGEHVLVDGRLRTVPDDQLSSSSCVGRVLLVSQGAGTLHFCPDSGTGFDIDDDGGTTYRFMNHDGNTLSVSLNRAGALQRVVLGKFSCVAPACSGVTMSPTAADGQREFGFHGTTLSGNAPDSTPTLLNGTVVLAAQ